MLLRRHHLRQRQRVHHAQPDHDARLSYPAAADHWGCRRRRRTGPQSTRTRRQLQPPVQRQHPAAARRLRCRLRVAYVGNRTRNNPRTKPGNLIDPALGRRPDTRIRSSRSAPSTGRASTTALQLQLNRRMSRGLCVQRGLHAFRRSTTTSISPQTPCAGSSTSTPARRGTSSGRASDLDAPHNLSVNSIYELPLRRARGLRGRLAGAGSSTPCCLRAAACPYTVQLGTTRSGTGWTTNQRPNVVPGVDGTGDPDGPNGWLNIAASRTPRAGHVRQPRPQHRARTEVRAARHVAAQADDDPTTAEAGVPHGSLQHPEQGHLGGDAARACSSRRRRSATCRTPSAAPSRSARRVRSSWPSALTSEQPSCF